MLIGITVAGVFLLSSHKAFATTTLKNVCGTEGAAMGADVGQHQLLCKTAYLNANSSIINDNNSRVYTSVAVVCAYSCIGGKSSCGNGEGGSGGSCSTAVQTGHKSYDASDQSDSDFEAAKANGHNALLTKSAVTELESGGGTLSRAGNSAVHGLTRLGGSSEVPRDSTLPAACRAASETGNVQSRIECATATDPSLPAFVKSPQFQSDFQRITGQSLQAVINQDGGDLLDRYATGALQSAFKSFDGKISLNDFMGRAGGLVSSLIGSFDEAKRKDVALSVIPPGMQGMVPMGSGPSLGTTPLGTALAGANGLSPVEPQAGLGEHALAERGLLTDRTPAETTAETPQSGGSLLAGLGNPPDPEFGASPENNPAISLFERVSRRYKTVSLRLNTQASLPLGDRQLASPY